MKKPFFIALFMAACLQQIQSQNRIGFVAGGLSAKSNLTNQNQSGVLSQTSTTFGSTYSFYGGIAYDIKVTNEFSIKSKLLYINKGWTETKDLRKDTSIIISSLSIGTNNIPIELTKSKEIYKFSYLELPVNFTFYTPIGKSLLSFGVGPYVSVGLSGKYNYKVLNLSKQVTEYKYDTMRNADPYIPATINTTIINRVSDDYLTDSTALIRFDGTGNKKALYIANRFDYGASIEVSIGFRIGLSVHANYTVGVTNVIKERYGALQNRNRVIMLGMGYYMKRKRKPSALSS